MPYGDRDVLTPDIFAFVQMRCEQDEQLAGERVEILLAIDRTPKLELLDDAALGVGHHAHDIELSRALAQRSEEHTSELQSLMRISYAVFCLKKKKQQQKMTERYDTTLAHSSIPVEMHPT